MFDVFIIILPLILLVATGYVAGSTGYLSRADWDGIERLSFKILIPALIIYAISHSDLSLKSSGPYVGAAVLTYLALGLLTLLLRPFITPQTLLNTGLSSLFQATTRWNALIVLPIADSLFGTTGLAAVTLAMAILIPLINIGNIVVISVLHARDFSLKTLMLNILKNPLIIASLIGLTLATFKISLPTPVDDTLRYVKSGALAVGLLCVGAGFDWRRLMQLDWRIIWGVGLKTILAPALFFALAQMLGLGQIETVCGMLVVSAPAATNGFIVARQMGGDAELYAYILSWQMVASIFTIPAMIYLTTF